MAQMLAPEGLEAAEASAAAAGASVEGKRVYVRRMFSEIAPL